MNNCNLIDDLSFVFNGDRTPARDPAFCDVQPPFQPQWKAQVSYPLTYGIQASATFQSLSGPELSAQLSADQRHRAPVARPQLHQRGADRRAAAAGHALRRPHLPDRLRFNKPIRAGGRRSARRCRSTTCSTPTRSRPTSPPSAPPGWRRRSSSIRGSWISACRSTSRSSTGRGRCDAVPCAFHLRSLRLSRTASASSTVVVQAFRPAILAQSRYQKLCSSTTFPFEKQTPLARNAEWLGLWL